MKLENNLVLETEDEVMEAFIPSMRNGFPLSFAGIWQNWMRRDNEEKCSIDEDEGHWQEPEVLIRLEDPSEGSPLAKLYTCHHCSFEWDDFNVLKSHIKAQHIPGDQPKAPSSLEKNGELSLNPVVTFTSPPSDECKLNSNSGSVEKKKKAQGRLKKKKKSFECPNCGFVCAKPKTLEKHLRLKHKDTKPFECHFCKFSTFYPKVLKRHIKSKHPTVQPYSCEQCIFTSHEESELKAHIINEHTNKLLHSCPYCHYVSGQCNALMAHVKVKHPNETVWQCLQCAVKPVESAGLFESKVKDKVGPVDKKVKSDEGKGSGGKIHECPDCEYRTPQLAHLKRHIISNHTFERPYKCVHCHYSTARSDHLRKHVINKHANENTYHCTECPFTSPHATDLKLHIKLIHTLCSNTNQSQESFPISSQYDAAEKSFKCSHCGYMSRRHDNLKRHIFAQHTNVKCYQCDYCVFSTYRLDKLRRHMDARHFKEKSFQCLFCNYCSPLSYNLKTHLLSHGWEYELP